MNIYNGVGDNYYYYIHILLIVYIHIASTKFLKLFREVCPILLSTKHLKLGIRCKLLLY